MIQEPYPSWPKPGVVREVDIFAPFNGSSDDAFRRQYRLRQRGPLARLRDWWRGYADVDLESFDAKICRMNDGAKVIFTDAELRANTFRRLAWGRK